MKTKAWFLSLLIALMAFQVQAQTVRVSGRQLFVNNQQYRINGICYSRGGVGNYTQDIALMKEANINTIRTYSPINDKAELDAFANAGIRIIMHLDENNFESYINTYKGHNAILMWEFGNEFNYHPEWFGGNLATWYSKLQACATRAHQLDTNHPVSTAHGELPDAATLGACPAVDVWGMNLYRWDNDVPALVDFAARSSKGMYVSECGGDSYNKATGQVREDQQQQANRNIVNGIIGRYDICMGVTVFEFCDEWWKAGNPDVQNTGGSAPNSSGVPYDGSPDEEYWGIVRRDRSKKPAFDDLKSIYASVSQTVLKGVSGLNGTYYLQNRNSGLFMDVANNGATADGTNILQWTGTNGTNQQFTITDQGNGIYKIICVKTGKAVDIDGVSTANFANVHQWSYVGGDNQQFAFQATDNGYYKLKAKHSRKIIEVGSAGKNDGDNINQYDDNGQTCGQWKLVPVASTFTKKIEAEAFNSMLGVQTEACSEGGSNVGYIDANDWMAYNAVTFPTTGIYTFEFRVASPGGAQLSADLNAGSIQLGSATITALGGWQSWQTVKFSTTVTAGTYNLGVFAKTGGWNFNWLQITSGLKAGQIEPDAAQITESVASSLTISPVPVANELTIRLGNEAENLAVKVINLSGSQLINTQLENGSTLDVSTLPSGAYILQVIANNQVATKKFIKK